MIHYLGQLLEILYQNTSISFTFQAYAIAKASFDSQFTDTTTAAERCETIVSAIYASQGNKFLNINVTD